MIIIIIIIIIINIIIIIIIVTITMWEFFIQMAYITQGGFAEKVVEKNVRSILGFQFIKIYFKKLLFNAASVIFFLEFCVTTGLHDPFSVISVKR